MDTKGDIHVEEHVHGRDSASKGPQAPIVMTAAENKRILRKVDLAILPVMLAVYCLQFLDKSTLSYAAVFDLKKHANLVGDQFQWLGSIVYVAQLVFQPLIAYLLVKFPIGKFCAIMVLCWGIVLCGMSAAKDFGSLMATRFLLGMFEASVAPTFIAIVQMWYRRSEQTLRNAFWYACLGFVTIFGSLLSWGLAHVQSNVLLPYQIIFLFCGLLTVLVSICVLVFLPDSPTKCRFLTGNDKQLAIDRVRMNRMGSLGSGVWRWDHVTECLFDVKSWLFTFMLASVSIPSGGISTFGPLIIQNFGLSQFETLLFNMPFGAVQIVATIGASWAATHWKAKSPILAVLCIPPIVGLAMLHSIPITARNRGVLLFAYYITSVYPAITPLIYSWSGQNTGGDTKRKVTTAMLFIGASAGNIGGPLLYHQEDNYTRGVASNLALFALIIVLVGVTVLYIKLLNRKHVDMRVAVGKPAKIVDLSMADKKRLEEQAETAAVTNDGGVGNNEEDDTTDLKNEDFVYVY